FHTRSYYTSAHPSFFFHATPPTKIYTLSLHDALPISSRRWRDCWATGTGRSPRRTMQPARRCPPSPGAPATAPAAQNRSPAPRGDRKSTRLNSSHVKISYAVFCLKKKKKKKHKKREKQ